jgi:prohibitin 1
MTRWTALLLAGSLLSGCVVINQGEVGVKRRSGRIRPEPIPPGLVSFDPFLTDIIKVPVRTVNREILLQLPSSDGLNIRAEVSILYRVIAERAPEIVGSIGVDYESAVVLTTFRSAAADVAAKFVARDMYTDSRSKIETAIRTSMQRQLGPRGFEVEAVLLKSIRLPDGLARAIEQKLEADQQAQRMEFTLQQETMEAERRRIEAQGIRDAQKLVAEGLTPTVLQWETIKALRALAASNNAKLVITDGKTPLMLGSSP